MEQRVLPRPEVVKLLKQFVTVQLYTDYVPIASITAAQRKELAEQNQETPARPGPGGDQPVLRGAHPRRQSPWPRMGGYNEPPVFLDFLTKALEKARGGMKVAQASPAHVSETRPQHPNVPATGSAARSSCFRSLDNCQRIILQLSSMAIARSGSGGSYHLRRGEG